MRRRQALVAAAGTALLGALAVWLVSTRVFPYYSLNHDEAVYLQQAALLLEGQFALYPPVEDAFRPWFFIEAGDRLYPKYAPVPAATFAVGVFLGAPKLALAGIGAGILGLTYGVASEAFDRTTGLLAAAFVLASPLFLVNTALFLPYAPTALLNLAFAFAYLRSDRLGSGRWAAVAGGAVGLAFFSRPYTAVLFATPFIAHACWTLWRDRREITLARRVTTAVFGLVGVVATLAYNAAVTGSPTRFPYEAFAPLDGLGFGTRRLLGYEAQYTPEVAVRANAQVVSVFFADWFAGGVLGTALAAVGIAVVVRRGITARQAALGGVFLSVIVGNVYFWGNYNILGQLSDVEDGMIAAIGPHYHYDLLLPTAAFAARGSVALARGLHSNVRDRLADVIDPRIARVGVAVILLVGAAGIGVGSATLLAEPIDDNTDRTEVYERAYEPFEDGPPANAVVFLPGPYGDWLNHPFQPLRNDPGYDGEAVYALDTRPFAVAEAFPDRRLYRYAYRGIWAPAVGSPEAARLTRVRDVRGERVILNATLGVPDGAESVTIRIESGGDSATYVAANASGALELRATLSPESGRLSGDLRPVGNATIDPAGEEVRITALVDYGAGNAFDYRLNLPIRTESDAIRALSPRIERCVNVRLCDGEAAYVPDVAPDGVFVRANLSAGEA
ncbi:MAG: ArnT family glycosyltransferase [Halobacteriales archaeon]